MNIYTNCKVSLGGIDFDFTGVEVLFNSAKNKVEKANCLFTGEDLTGWFE